MVKVIYSPRCISYAQQGHPERPERISRAAGRLKQQSRIAVEWVEPEPCPDEPILRAHDPDHLARLQIPRDLDTDTPFFKDILGHARFSAGAGLKALELARNGEQVFSLMRPPGHHATRARAMGFCYLNNAAIACLHALVSGIDRVAVFDFDVHHGNGTEAILLDVPGTAFFSVHQFPCYPGTGTRNLGSNCFNYPVPPQTARQEYRHILLDALEHLKGFDPSLVIVSAGFDCYSRDPLAQETLESEDFEWLGGNLRKLSLPVLSLLEGGYSNDLPELILAYLQGIDAG